MHIGIVADDLTGAMDAAAPFADIGIGTAVALNCDGPLPASAPALSIDTDTREALPQDAADTVHRTMAKLRAAGARLPFKKIDSTLRGNIGAETLAALAGSGRRHAIIAPAAPAQGRLLRDGQLFVHGRRLQMNLTDMLRFELPGVSVQPLLPGGGPFVPAGDGCCVWVADAQDEADLDRVARLGWDRDDVLLVGSSGLAGALARRQGVGTLSGQAKQQPGYRRVWFIVGSRNSRSAQQVRALIAHDGVTKLVLPLAGGMPELSERDASGDCGIGVIHVEGLDAPAASDPRRIAAQLGELAAAVLGLAPHARTALVMAGGDTARATLARLGVESVDVLASLFPGVVHGTARVAGQELGIVTKAGGFGDPDLFVRLAARLGMAP
jgi:uncharacterized protein YgbK (DUF1537 family)